MRSHETIDLEGTRYRVSYNVTKTLTYYGGIYEPDEYFYDVEVFAAQQVDADGEEIKTVYDVEILEEIRLWLMEELNQ